MLILDEPTTGIRLPQKEKLFATLKKLAEQGMTILFVSHKLEEVEQLRHENRILTSEVHALNIEMESFRLGQENFASANLAAETERVVKHRREHERLESALAERDAELQGLHREHEELVREADLLRKEAARLQISEERLQSAVDLQRAETAQHVSALSALSREMEALRRAFLGEDVQLASHEGDLNEPGEGAVGGEALEEAEARIASLESRLTQMELEGSVISSRAFTGSLGLSVMAHNAT